MKTKKQKKNQEASENQEKGESNQDSGGVDDSRHETLKSGVIIAASLGAFAIYRIFR